MAERVQESEIKKAVAMASRKAGVTRRQLAEKLSILPTRAKVVIEHAMKLGGSWSSEPSGSGRDNRTIVFKRSEQAYKRKGKAPKTKSRTSRPRTKKKARKKVGAKG